MLLATKNGLSSDHLNLSWDVVQVSIASLATVYLPAGILMPAYTVSGTVIADLDFYDGTAWVRVGYAHTYEGTLLVSDGNNWRVRQLITSTGVLAVMRLV